MAERATTPDLSVWARYGAALKYAEYRRFWVSATVAGAGVWGLIVARAALAFRVSDDSATAVGIVTFAAMIPFVVVPPFSGILADRLDRRHLIAAAHATNVIFALALAWLYFYADVAIWHLVTLSLLSGIARGVQLPASSALVPNLVPREDLLNAIALNNVSLQGSRLLGGITVSILLEAEWGIGGAFLLAVGMYILATFAVLSIRTRSTGVIPKGAGIWEVFTAGAVYAYRNRPVGFMLAFVALHCGLTMAFESVYPTHATQALGQDSTAFALIIAVFGAGAVLGVVSIAGIRDDRTKGRALLFTAVGSSIAVVAMAYSTNIGFGLAAAFVAGLFQAPFMSLSITFIQSVVPDAIRGRVSSLFTMSALSLMALANLAYGWLADLYSSVSVLAVPATVFFAVTALGLLLFGTLRKILISGFDTVGTQPAPAPSGGSE